MLITVIVLCISALTTWASLYLLLVKINDLQSQIETLTRVHNWNVSELMHRSEQLQEVEVVKL